jgi:transposase-like protein
MKKKNVRIVYSESFKRKKVSEIELGELTISQLTRSIGMKNPTSIYRWISKYGKSSKAEKIVCETESDYLKFNDSEKERSKLEQLVGRQQLMLSYYEELLNVAREHYNEDLEEKFLKKL